MVKLDKAINRAIGGFQRESETCKTVIELERGLKEKAKRLKGVDFVCVGYSNISGLFVTNKTECDCEDYPIKHLAFTKKDLSLLRTYGRSRSDYKKYFGTKWGYVLGVYRSVLPLHVRKFFDKWIFKMPNGICERCFIDALKNLSQQCLKRVVEYSRFELRYFLDLKVLGGYDTVLNRDDAFNNYANDYGKHKVGADIYKYIDKYVDKISFGKIPYSFRDFVSFRDAWSAGGVATSGKACKLIFKKGNDVRKIRVKNKWFANLIYDDDMLTEKCLDGGDTIVRPFVKEDEAAACRTVQSYDTFSFIRCCFLGQSIKSYNGHSSWTSIGLSDNQKFRLYKKILSYKGEGWFLCTDQDKFDLHQSKDWVLYTMRALFSKILQLNPECEDVIQAELESLQKVYLLYNKKALKWQNGLLSGYFFTALVGSILNAAASRYVLESLNAEIMFERYQGDDAIVVLKNKIDVSDVVRKYEEAGLSINPDKTWHSRINTEYLHELYFDGNVYGFPARSFRSLLWRKPGFKTVDIVSRTNAYLSCCLMAFRRGLFPSNIVRNFVRSQMKMDVTSNKYKEWLHTPLCFGGFGLGDSGRVCLEHTKSVKKTFKLDFQIGAFGASLPIEVFKSAVLVRAMGVVPFPGITNKFYFKKTRGDSKMPQIDYSVYREQRFKTDWTLSDLRTHADSYLRKLRLEWKLKTGRSIVLEDLPGSGWNLVGRNIDKVYRRYVRILDWSVDFANQYTNSIGVYKYKDIFSNFWTGICAFLARYGFRVALQRLGVSDLEIVRRSLLSTVFSMFKVDSLETKVVV